jgi:hypothetical protein
LKRRGLAECGEAQQDQEGRGLHALV